MAQAPDKEGKSHPKTSDPMGPYAPPLPTEAERTEGEPMAVANDKRTQHQSFLPTTQSKDAYDPEVAQRWKTVPDSARREGDVSGDRASANPRDAQRRAGSPEAEKPETVEQEKRPPGYTDVDEKGFKHLKWDADEATEPGDRTEKG